VLFKQKVVQLKLRRTTFELRSMTKTKVYEACMAKVNTQLAELQAAIDKVQESIVGEENSTSGNKYETARAMGQEELDRLNQTMNNAIRERNILIQIRPEKECSSAQLGAVVATDNKQMYISVGIGKLEVEGQIIFAVSAISPIGQAIMGLLPGDDVLFAGKKEKIIAIE
jgi:transcription elongation GreA/GreB family factor